MPSHRLLLDTHVWIWVVAGDARLASGMRGLIERAAGRAALSIAAISMWEITILAAHGRITLAKPTLEWIENALRSSSVAIEPLTPRIAADSCELPGRFHNDPADRLIVATARATDASLMTRDRRMLDYAALGHMRALAA